MSLSPHLSLSSFSLPLCSARVSNLASAQVPPSLSQVRSPFTRGNKRNAPFLSLLGFKPLSHTEVKRSTPFLICSFFVVSSCMARTSTGLFDIHYLSTLLRSNCSGLTSKQGGILNHNPYCRHIYTLSLSRHRHSIALALKCANSKSPL